MSISNFVFGCIFLRYIVVTICHILSRKMMTILCFVMFLMPVIIYYHISDKVVIALWPRAILANISLFSHILMLPHAPESP